MVSLGHARDGPADAETVGAHRHGAQLAVLVSTLRSSALRVLVPSWKMCPIRCRAPTPGGPQGAGVAVAPRRSMVPSAVKSRRRRGRRHVSRLVGTGHPCGALADPGGRAMSGVRRLLGAEDPARCSPLASTGLAASPYSSNASTVAGSTWAPSRFSSTRGRGQPDLSGSRVPRGARAPPANVLTLSEAAQAPRRSVEHRPRCATRVSMVGVSWCPRRARRDPGRVTASGTGTRTPRRWPRSAVGAGT